LRIDPFLLIDVAKFGAKSSTDGDFKRTSGMEELRDRSRNRGRRLGNFIHLTVVGVRACASDV